MTAYEEDVIELKDYVILRDENGIPILHPEKTQRVMNSPFEVDEIIDMFAFDYHMNTLDNERQYVISLDYYNIPKGICLISAGDYKETMLCMRTIGEFLLLTGAEKFLVVHNHPSDNELPSGNDILCEQQFKQIGALFDIELIGSCIISEHRWFDIGEMKSHSFDELEYNEKTGW